MARGERRADRLTRAAASAAALRRHQADPDVIALAVERVRTQVDVMLWTAVVGALAFTTVNVQAFAAGIAGATRGDAGWWTAWLLDPIVSVPLIAVLLAEQITSRYQLPTPRWARITKWLTFACTYVMNTWNSWGQVFAGHSPNAVMLHSVPPLLVLAVAETGPVLRHVLTDAVRRALTTPDDGPTVVTATAQIEPRVEQPTPDPGTAVRPIEPGSTPTAIEPPAADAASRPAKRPVKRAAKRVHNTTTRRRLKEDYLIEAREKLATAPPGTTPTTTWCKKVTGCGGSTATFVSHALQTEIANQSTTPIETDPPEPFANAHPQPVANTDTPPVANTSTQTSPTSAGGVVGPFLTATANAHDETSREVAA